jgi:hypothetical protein
MYIGFLKDYRCISFIFENSELPKKGKFGHHSNLTLNPKLVRRGAEGVEGSSGPGLQGTPVLTPLGVKLNVYTL